MYVAEADKEMVAAEPVFDSVPEKAAYVQTMFDDIAPRYDVLNSVSLRRHTFLLADIRQQAAPHCSLEMPFSTCAREPGNGQCPLEKLWVLQAQ